MTPARALEHDLRAWLEGDAPPAAPADLLTAVIAGAAVQRQNPRWLARPNVPAGIWVPSRVLAVMALMVLMAALAAGAVAVLSQPRTLPLAARANGLITFTEGHDLMVVNIDGSGRRALTTTPWSDETYPMWSPDGSRIAYVRCVQASAVCDQGTYGSGPILTTSASGGAETELVPAPSDWIAYMAWSPDGSQLAYIHGASFVLSVVSSDGSSPRDLVSDVGSFAWSPDGTRLAATMRVARIAVVDVASGATTAVTLGAWHDEFGALRADAEVNVIGWSPDGTLIAFARAEVTKNGPWRIEVVHPDGSGRTVLNDQVAEGGVGVPNATLGSVFSPDGTLLAFTDVQSGHFNVAVIAPDGAGFRMVRADGVFVGWSPDGRYLIVQPFDQSSDPVFAVALDGSGDLKFNVPWSGVWQGLPQ